MSGRGRSERTFDYAAESGPSGKEVSDSSFDRESQSFRSSRGSRGGTKPWRGGASEFGNRRGGRSERGKNKSQGAKERVGPFGLTADMGGLKLEKPAALKTATASDFDNDKVTKTDCWSSIGELKARKVENRRVFTPNLKGYIPLVNGVLGRYRTEDQKMSRIVSEPMFRYWGVFALWQRILQIKRELSLPMSTDEVNVLLAASKMRIALPQPIADYLDMLGAICIDGKEYLPDFPPLPTAVVAGIGGGIAMTDAVTVMLSEVPTPGVCLRVCLMEVAAGVAGPIVPEPDIPVYHHLGAAAPAGAAVVTTNALQGNGMIPAGQQTILNAYATCGLAGGSSGPVLGDTGINLHLVAHVQGVVDKLESFEKRVINMDVKPIGGTVQFIKTDACEPAPALNLTSSQGSRTAEYYTDPHVGTWAAALVHAFNDYVPDELPAAGPTPNLRWASLRATAGFANVGHTPPFMNAIRNGRRNVPPKFVAAEYRMDDTESDVLRSNLLRQQDKKFSL